jgi:hypothetical protein
MNFKNTTLALLAVLLGGLFISGAPNRAHAQSYTGTIPSGNVYGNGTAGAAKPSGTPVGTLLDRVFGSTDGSVLYRSGGSWAESTNPALLYGIFNGTSAPASAAGQSVVGGTFAVPTLANNGQAWLYNTTAGGAAFQGQGSSTDLVFRNKGGSTVCSVATGTQTIACNTLSLTNALAVGNGGTGGNAASGTLLDNITGFAGTGYIRRTGAGAYAFSAAASGAQYLAGTATNVPLEPSVIYQAETTTTFGATTTFDFSTFINTAVTLTGNITTMTLSNVKAGQAGTITFIQDGTGSRTTVWNSNFKFAGGATPTLSTAAGKIDVLSYSCRSATFCVASLLTDVR